MLKIGNMCQRTSESLYEGLPIKMARKSLKNDTFSMVNLVDSVFELSAKKAFHTGQVWVLLFNISESESTYRK